MNFRQYLEMSQKAIYGWLSPRGNFYPVEVFNHLESIGSISELKKLIPFYDQEMEKIEQLANQSLQQQDQGEHPEWHVYEIAKNNLTSEIIRSLYNSGCLRVGSVGLTMHFEGRPAGIQNLHRIANDLAEEYGMIAKFDPQRY